jgi:perosamine synthetase
MIPVSATALSTKAKKYLAECIDTSWISSEGEFVKKFETEFAKYLGVKHAITVNSGTSALHVGLMSLGLKPGDEVILPASTIAACYFAIWYWGGVAVPVDVELETYNIDPTLIEAAITPRTKAIMVVHLYGRPANMAAIQKIARKHKLIILEDAAEAHGAELNGKKVGGIGAVGCFSFYANKLVTTGEGGAVVTNSDKIAAKIRSLKSMSRYKNFRFIHEALGYSLNMSNLQAAVGLAQLESVEDYIGRKIAMAQYYNQHLANIPGLILPADFTEGRQVYWMYAVRIETKKFGCSRDEFSRILWEDHKIQTRPFFNAPRVAFKPMGKYQDRHFPVAEKIGREGLYLPSGTGQTTDDFAKVVKTVKAIAKKVKQKSN